MKWQGIIGIGCVVLLLGAGLASATEITFQEGMLGYTGMVDTHIMSDDPDATAGDLNKLKLGRDSVGPEFRLMLLRFDNIFGAGAIPNDALSIDTATLTLTNSYGTGPVPDIGIKYYDLSVAFVEGEACWDERSSGVEWANDNPMDGGNVGTKIYGSANSGADIVIDVTVMLRDWFNGTEPNYGLTIWPNGDTTSDGYYSSSEWSLGSVRPKLTVDYTIPEPATMSLLGIGGLLMLVRKKR